MSWPSVFPATILDPIVSLGSQKCSYPIGDRCPCVRRSAGKIIAKAFHPHRWSSRSFVPGIRAERDCPRPRFVCRHLDFLDKCIIYPGDIKWTFDSQIDIVDSRDRCVRIVKPDAIKSQGFGDLKEFSLSVEKRPTTQPDFLRSFKGVPLSLPQFVINSRAVHDGPRRVDYLALHITSIFIAGSVEVSRDFLLFFLGKGLPSIPEVQLFASTLDCDLEPVPVIFGPLQ